MERVPISYACHGIFQSFSSVMDFRIENQVCKAFIFNTYSAFTPRNTPKAKSSFQVIV